MRNTGLRIGLASDGSLVFVHNVPKGEIKSYHAVGLRDLYSVPLHPELKQEEVRAVLETLMELLKEKKGG